MATQLNIVVPMAGRGSRFQQAGFETPKPLIPIFGKPMIEWVVDNLTPQVPHRWIFLCLQEHIESLGVADFLKRKLPECIIVPVKSVTEGAACTVLLAESYINSDNPLMIANSDQWIDMNIDSYLEAFDRSQSDGFIMTMKAKDPKWSFVRLDDKSMVTEVVEKKVVSDQATVGIYNFKKGSDFVHAAREMIEAGERVNGEFYVAPVYNRMISKKARVGFQCIGRDSDYRPSNSDDEKYKVSMFGLGTPQDLEIFVKSSQGRARVQFDLVIPLWNESKNISHLIEAIEAVALPAKGLRKAILLNNGSQDNTADVVNALSQKYSWVQPVHLSENKNYGGGVMEGMRYTRAPYVGYVPGDNQIQADDILKVWQQLKDALYKHPLKYKLFMKGVRTTRLDPFSTQLTSVIYTLGAKLFLGLGVRDVNGLPKLFHRSLLDLLPEFRMTTFSLDAQLLDVASRNHWSFEEVPVTFHARREGVSSWSGKRLKTYWLTFQNIMRIRTLRKERPKVLEMSSSSHEY